MASMKTLLILLPPASVLLVLAVQCLCRAATRGLSAVWRAQFACPPAGGGPASSSSFRYLSAAHRRAIRELPVAPYMRRRSGCAGGGEEGEEEQEAVECAFCLSGIEEGEEVRELRCRHLFHRSCLDRWLLARPLATCPLCRRRLLTPSSPPAAQAPWDEEDDDDGVEEDSDSDMMLFMACVHGRSSWFWPS
ncbi:hypothetical protein ACP70R_005009 [Stipagrostis hirtigluma subsp. patula]